MSILRDGFKAEDFTKVSSDTDEYGHLVFSGKICQILADRANKLLQAELKEAVRVIEFYGNSDNYNPETGSLHDMVPKGMRKPQKLWKVLEFGERARAFLEKLKGDG